MHGVQTVDGTKTGGSPWWSALITILPFLLFFVFWIFLMNQMQGGGSKVMSFGKSRAKRMSVDSPKITFKDVAGVDEAVEELQEIKEFLENPKKFQALGARIPKGVLLFGPPGTGKTLLARAVAGEAGVPFFSISGSDFVEMFVGVGASRVRDLFEQAKQNSPCIIFMDEIDAVGRHRGAGMGGGHDEREQTLNQLLVEMDGFEMKDNVILIAATNRPDILDPALLRPGRFDRQVVVDRPDRVGRKKILEVHSRGKPMSPAGRHRGAGRPDARVHRRRPGQPGERGRAARRPQGQEADREPGARRGHHARDRRAREEDPAALARRSARSPPCTRWATRSSGHFLEHNDPVHKISIVGRGMALGYVVTLPSEDKFMRSRAELLDGLAKNLGGRTAEELVFGEVTTGAEDDLNKTTDTAKRMVTRWGMSEKLGPRTFGRDSSQPFLGRDFGHEADYSEEIAREIDDEIRRIVEQAHERAREVLGGSIDELNRMSKILIQYETFDAEPVPAAARRRGPRGGLRRSGAQGDRDARRGSRARSPSRPRGLGLPLPGNIASGQPPESPQPS